MPTDDPALEKRTVSALLSTASGGIISQPAAKSMPTFAESLRTPEVILPLRRRQSSIKYDEAIDTVVRFDIETRSPDGLEAAYVDVKTELSKRIERQLAQAINKGVADATSIMSGTVASSNKADAVFDIGKLKKLMADMGLPAQGGPAHQIYDLKSLPMGGGKWAMGGKFDMPLLRGGILGMAGLEPLNIKRTRKKSEKPFFYRTHDGTVTVFPITREIMALASQHCRATNTDTFKFALKREFKATDTIDTIIEPFYVTVRVQWRKGKGLKAPAFLYFATQRDLETFVEAIQ